VILRATAAGQGHPVPDRRKAAVFDVLDIGQGDAILIQSPEGRTAFVDAGPRKENVPLLKRLGEPPNLVACARYLLANDVSGCENMAAV
jgi:hypothetical protein